MPPLVACGLTLKFGLLQGAAISSLKLLTRGNCYRAAIAKTSRNHFVYTFPTMLVHPDGSTTIIRYKEPRQIIKLPLDATTLSEEEKKQRLLLRKSTQTKIVEQQIDVDFDSAQYEFLWKGGK